MSGAKFFSPLSLLLTLFCFATDAQALDALGHRHVLIVGDSEACAVGMQVQGFVKGRSERDGHPVDIVDVVCKTGSPIQYWAADHRFTHVLVEHPSTDVVMIFLGTNNHESVELPPVQPILDAVRESGAKCLWVGNTKVRGYHWRINELLRGAVGPTCEYNDTEKADIPLADGVHPTRQGVLSWLQSLWSTQTMRGSR